MISDLPYQAPNQSVINSKTISDADDTSLVSVTFIATLNSIPVSDTYDVEGFLHPS